MESQLTALQADQDRLEERLEALELRGAVSARASQRTAEREAERPRLKIIRLSPDDPSGGGGAAPPVPDRAEPEPEDNRPVIRGQGDRVIKVGDPEAVNRSEAKAEYEAALALVRSKSYAVAIEMLGDFVKRQPRGPYADNALYWLGECEIALGDVDGAIERFDEVVSRYPYGNKVGAARQRKRALLARLAERNAEAATHVTQPFKTADATQRTAR
jgi:TolA-binding protein